MTILYLIVAFIGLRGLMKYSDTNSMFFLVYLVLFVASMVEFALSLQHQ